MSKTMSNIPEDGRWAPLAYRLAISTVCHPLEYGKTLIQLGHEPIAPYATKTLLGKPARGLPGIFDYVKYIRKVDGLSGCYRGVGLRLCALSVGSIAQTITLEKLQEGSDTYETEEVADNESFSLVCAANWRKFKKNVGYEMTARVVATVASQPLNVCVVRCMAQFVGRETQYNGIVSCIREIYAEEGIWGFFSGLIPRCLAEVSHIIIVSALAYLVNNYFLKDEDPYNLAPTGINFLASTITYPLLVVSNCMIVNNCGLAAGVPPHMPIYLNWRECFWDLYSRNQLKRGSSLLWRYAT